MLRLGWSDNPATHLKYIEHYLSLCRRCSMKYHEVGRPRPEFAILTSIDNFSIFFQLLCQYTYPETFAFKFKVLLKAAVERANEAIESLHNYYHDNK